MSKSKKSVWPMSSSYYGFDCFAVWQDTLWQLQMCSEESWLVLSVGESKSGGTSCPCRIVISRYWFCHSSWHLLPPSTMLHSLCSEKPPMDSARCLFIDRPVQLWSMTKPSSRALTSQLELGEYKDSLLKISLNLHNLIRYFSVGIWILYPPSTFCRLMVHVLKLSVCPSLHWLYWSFSSNQ